MGSCTLSGSSKEYTWAPEDPSDSMEDDDPKVKPSHRLLVKMAILMPTAKKDEVSIIQVESEGYNKKKVVVPICAMKEVCGPAHPWSCKVDPAARRGAYLSRRQSLRGLLRIQGRCCGIRGRRRGHCRRRGCRG